MVNLGKGFRGDQVLSCRSVCGVFSQDLARLAENGENRMLVSPFTSALFQPRVGVMESDVFPAQIMGV